MSTEKHLPGRESRFNHWDAGIIRPATPDEAALLSDLALRSKGHWGYDAAFLEKCREDLTITPDYIAECSVFVLEETQQIVGFYGLWKQPGPLAELEHLYVEPAAIGKGYGKRLWQHALTTAQALGCGQMILGADPFAEPFYLAMGAKKIGMVPSTMDEEGLIPLMSIAWGEVVIDGTDFFC